MKQILYTLLLAGLSHFPLTITTFYVAPILAAGLLGSQEARGQVFLPPKGDINIHQSLDATTNAKIYNAGKTKSQRDSILDVRFAEDWTNQVPSAENWNCDQYALETVVHAYNWGEGVYYNNNPLYNNYAGSELDLQKLYQNGGTLKDAGTLGLPMCFASLTDSITKPAGHTMNAVLTGDDATKFEDWTFKEPSNDLSEKPGQGTFPYNCKHVKIEYPYLFKKSGQEKNFFTWKILEFEVTNGVGKLIYNINDDNTTIIPWASPEPLNKYIHLIEKRSDIIDTATKYHQLENSVKVYPNPAHNYINIESKLNEETTNKITIFDITGRLIREYTTREPIEKIDVSDLPAAMYHIRIVASNQVYNGKFIKR
jgi:hypothetical protein